MKVEESLNVTFDESPPLTKLSPLVDDDVGEEEAIKKNTRVVNNNNQEDESIEVDEIVNIKESKNHPLDQVIGNLNQRTLRSQAQNHSDYVDRKSTSGVCTFIGQSRDLVTGSCSGCSSHMTGNKAYLSDYEDYNGGFMAFGSDPKGGKITTECLILSPSFKLLDESQVVLRAPRKDDVYNLNLMNIVPSGGSSGKDKEPTQEYILLPLYPHKTRIPIEDVALAAHEKPSESSSKDNDGQYSEDVANKEGQHQMTEDEQVLHYELEKMIAQEIVAKALDDATKQAFDKEKRNIASQKRVTQATSINKLSTGRSSVSTATTLYVSTATIPTGANADLPIDLNMPDLEDDSDVFSNDDLFNGAYDDENVGQIHKNYPKDQILGDPKSAVQTRGKIQKASSAQQALMKRVEAMQEELLQFNHTELDTCLDFHLEKAIGTKWEEGIDYDEVFAPVARIEAIRYFCSLLHHTWDYCLPNGMLKVHFLDGTIEEECNVHHLLEAGNETHFLLSDGKCLGEKSMCTEFEECMHKRFQMSSMGELTFFLGLQVKQQPDGIFISQDKYVADILKKFDFLSIRTATTPIESNKSLVKDEDGVDVDVHVYRSMIGSLMYLTASRPDIMFAVCACARFQVTPKASHLNAVKRIFRYLKHQPKLGLWYPRDSPFELEAFSDSDYGGASLDRKSTTGGCQFLGRRLISWQCKKQTIMANSTTEAEYVAAANCCGQVLWIQNQMMDYGFNFMNTKIHIDNESTISVIKNPVAHSRTKHIEIRFHFIRDCYEKRLIEVIKIHTDSNVADLLTKGFDVTRFNFLVVSIGLLNL
ncbi:putative ribonuclease H-like domain-containing protein [Tanacetum coccineum]